MGRQPPCEGYSLVSCCNLLESRFPGFSEGRKPSWGSTAFANSELFKAQHWPLLLFPWNSGKCCWLRISGGRSIPLGANETVEPAGHPCPPGLLGREEAAVLLAFVPYVLSKGSFWRFLGAPMACSHGDLEFSGAGPEAWRWLPGVSEIL